MVTEKEAWGVDYERYALCDLQRRWVKRLGLKTIVDIPASGVKAMPSIYSVGYGDAGCHVSLLNPEKQGITAWEKLDYDFSYKNSKSITKTPYKDNSFDLAWNFAIFPEITDKINLLKEMGRISKKYVAVFAVNGYNWGSQVHQMLHHINKVPWTHGDKKILYYQNLSKLFKKAGLRVKEVGVVDTPPWPDSIGFRDMRLHRMNIQPTNTQWESNTLEWIKTKKYPSWIKWVHLFEKMPMIFPIKLLYAHIYYVLGEKL